jgi:hypothetical protein
MAVPAPTFEFQHRPWVGGDHLGQPRETLALRKIRAVHLPRHGGARGGDPLTFSCSLLKMAVAPDSTRRCTALTMAVYTVTSGDHPDFCYARPSLGGHRPRGGGATEQPVAVPSGQHATLSLPAGHRHRGGDALDKRWRFHPSSTLSPVLPPLLYQLLHLCKCANTKCPPTCAHVLAFYKHFTKGLVTQLTTPLDPNNDAKLDHSSGTR